MTPYVLVDVPESESDSTRKRNHYLLARTANLHAYLQLLAVHAAYERARLKAIGSAKADDMLKKKEALYELAGAVKLKYEAVSRQITLSMGEEDDRHVHDRPDYEARARAANPESKKSDVTTGARPSPSNKHGGWSNV